MEKHESKSRQVKPAITAFVLSFAAILLLLTAQFVWKYNEEILFNNLDVSVIFEIVLLAMIHLIIYALPISILVMTTVYYRIIFKQGMRKLKLQKGLLYSIVFSIFCFFWVAFLAPANNLRFYGLLIDVRSKAPDRPLERNDVALLKSYRGTCNYVELNEQIDKLKLSLPGEKISTKKYSAYMREETKEQINKYRSEKIKMLAYPFLVFILIYTGVFLGILTRKIKLFFVLTGIYVFIFPGIYFLSSYFYKLSVNSAISSIVGQVILLMVFALFTLVLFINTRKQLLKME